jgi:DNA (cytosine-5)-methyltransferase 1
MAKQKPIAIDIFCGCGGTTQGLKDAGFRVIGGVENDPLAVATFRINHKRVKVWDQSICDLSPQQLLEHHGLLPGKLDLLAGCPPCQAFSSMRRLNGKRRIYDRASKDLVLEYLRFVEGLHPKVVLIENVPRLIEDYRFNQVRKRLRELGYVGEPAILNAAHFGVAQRRRRLIFIASRIGPIDYADFCSEDQRLTVRDVIEDMPTPGRSGDDLHDFPEVRSEKIVRLIAMIPKDGGSRSALGPEQQLQCHKKCNGFKDVYGRMAWDDVSPTITGGCFNPSKGRFLHPQENRTITLREAALLQSFPPDYFFSLERGKCAAAQMIGNAFPPKFVMPHALKIRHHIQTEIHRNSK